MHDNMIFSTSNKTKMKEFKAILPDLIIKKGPDLKEVDGTIEEVILHKSKDMGPGYLVEDTILIINDEVVVDIKWKVKNLKEGDKATWITSLGYNDGENIYIYQGSIEGVITLKKGNEGFAFDPYFVPLELVNPTDDMNYDLKGLTLTLLDKFGLKKFFSARYKALINLKEGNTFCKIPVKNILPWTGTYQNS